MPLFDWDDMYSVNIKAVDEQHKHLVNIINDLYRSLLSRTPQENMYDILDRMLLYATFHFQDEEKLLKEHDYPFYESHKLKHEKFVDKTIEYIEKFKSGELKPSTDIANYLKDWLKKHIMGDDKEFSQYLKEREVH